MKWLNGWLDDVTENSTRGIAQRTSRRGFIGKLAGAVAGGAAVIPLLPIARGQEAANASPEEEGDQTSCDYWRYCAIDGFLCSCCGGKDQESAGRARQGVAAGRQGSHQLARARHSIKDERACVPGIRGHH